MAQVSVADIAADFHPDHAVTVILFILNDVVFKRFGEAGPATAGVKFLTGVEKLGATAFAGIQSRVDALTVFSAESHLGSPETRDAVVLCRKQIPPFYVAFLYPAIGWGIAFPADTHDFVPVHGGGVLWFWVCLIGIGYGIA
jgi:hypothetical protein